MSTQKMVILAAGLGSRMRKAADDKSELSEEQQAAAGEGMKAMMPIGRPFLDHCLNAYADAGITKVCLVIGPTHQAIRDYYESLELTRITVDFAIQEQPLGTANAVAAARDFVGDDPFIVVNGDNFYPTNVIAGLSELPANGMAGFVPSALIEFSNIPEDRIRGFGIIDRDDEGNAIGILEKPTEEELAARVDGLLVNMNCFRFTPDVFPVIDSLPLSIRGEYEITDAMMGLIQAGKQFQVVPVEAGVLDMSSRGDVSAVEGILRDRPVVL